MVLYEAPSLQSDAGGGTVFGPEHGDLRLAASSENSHNSRITKNRFIEWKHWKCSYRQTASVNHCKGEEYSCIKSDSAAACTKLS